MAAHADEVISLDGLEGKTRPQQLTIFKRFLKIENHRIKLAHRSGMDGFQVIDTLKSDPVLDKIPVIVLTAKELTPRERKRLSGQINILLQKGSFLDEELLQSIIQTLK